MRLLDTAGHLVLVCPEKVLGAVDLSMEPSAAGYTFPITHLLLMGSLGLFVRGPCDEIMRQVLEAQDA